VSVEKASIVSVELDEPLDEASFRHVATSVGDRLGARRIGASVYPDSDKISGPEGIHLRKSAVGYWHGEGTAGPSESVEIVREPETSPPQPAVNVLAVRAEAADPHAPPGFRYRAAKLGPLLGADRLDGMVVELDPGEGSEPYHYVYGREEWLLVLAGKPTLRHRQGEDHLGAGDLVCLPEGPTGAHRLLNRGESVARVRAVPVDDGSAGQRLLPGHRALADPKRAGPG